MMAGLKGRFWIVVPKHLAADRAEEIDLAELHNSTLAEPPHDPDIMSDCKLHDVVPFAGAIRV